MTTPKELAEELRRLAAAAETLSKVDGGSVAARYYGQSKAFQQAAQMVEERLK
jgi:hypothetical protein